MKLTEVFARAKAENRAALIGYMPAGFPVTRAPMGPIVRGAAPYVGLMIAVMAAVMLWPDIALWLPGTMMGR